MYTETQKPRPMEREAAFKNNTRMNFKRFPAYGKQLDDLRKKNLIPAKRVIVAFDYQIFSFDIWLVCMCRLFIMIAMRRSCPLWSTKY